MSRHKIAKFPAIYLKKINIICDKLCQYQDEAVKNTYEGDFTNTVGLVFTRDAIATVTLMGLKGEVSWNPRFLHHLMTFRIAQGHGILRPECAVELSKEAGE